MAQETPRSREGQVSGGHEDEDGIDWSSNSRHRENIQRKARVKRGLFRPHVTGDVDVLHVGCGGGDVGRPGEDGWFHADLDEMTAGDLVGIDIDEAAVRSARERGHDIRLEDATSYSLDREFDVVAAPNVIEHVANPGELLACARDHLRPGGELLVTTDRMLIPWWLLQSLKNGSPEPHPEHTMHFCKDHLEELYARVGLDITHYESWGFERLGITPADRAWRAVERMLRHLPGLHEIDHVQHFVVAEPGE